MSDKMAFDSDIAQEYDKGVRRTLPTYDQLLRLSHTFLRSKLGAEAAVLVVGGGGGNELITFGPPNPDWRFTAVDPSKAMLEAARMKAQQNDMEKRTILIHGTVEDVPEEAIFDAATCLLVLHFVAEVEDKLALLKKLRSHLKAGAPLVLASKYGDPQDEEFQEQVALWKNYWLDMTNLSEEKVENLLKSTLVEASIPEEKLRELLAEAGFRKIAKFFKTNHFGGWVCYAG